MKLTVKQLKDMLAKAEDNMEIEFNIKMETRSISGYDQHIYHQSADSCSIFQRDKLVINIDSKLVHHEYHELLHDNCAATAMSIDSNIDQITTPRSEDSWYVNLRNV